MKPDALNLVAITQRFSTEESAREYVESLLWPRGPVCPFCGIGSERVARLRRHDDVANPIRPGLCKCRDCRKKFTVTVGTIFEDSHVPLNLWLIAVFIMCSAKKSVSAHQLHRSLGVTYKTAWFMAHRIRYALKDPAFAGKLSGTVEVDECYFGPKSTNGRPRVKSAVVALVQRDTGERRSVVLDRLTAKDLKQAVVDHVTAGATLNTDELPLYRDLRYVYNHKTNYHSKEEAERDGKPRYYFKDSVTGEAVTTNYVESSFSLLRRGVVGSFHHISRKHLGLYVAEFDFRWNHRKTTDGERTVAGFNRVVGKRLSYKPLVGKDKPADPQMKKRTRKEHGPHIPPPPQWWLDQQKEKGD